MKRNADIWLLLDSSQGGGIETHVRGLAQGLRAAGLEAEVIFLKDHGPHPLRAQLDRDGTPWRNLSGGLVDLCRAINRARPWLLHTHGYKAGIFGRLAAKMTGVTCVHTYHGGEPGSGRVRLWQWLDRRSGALNDARIAVSKPISRQLSAAAHTIPNFVSLPDFVETNGRKLRVAFVGRLSHEKGPDIFCAIARLAAERISFHAYGDGPMRRQLEQQYGDVVQFHGYTDDMERVWSDTDLLLITSRHEGLPLVALEAMSRGVSVAASAVGALPEVIEHGVSGWLFDAHNVGDASEAIGRWLGTPAEELAHMRRRAREKVEDTYSRSVVLQQIIAVYRGALRGKRPSARHGVKPQTGWRG